MLSVVEWNNSHPNFDEACSLFLSEVSDRDTKQKGYSGSYNQQAMLLCRNCIVDASALSERDPFVQTYFLGSKTI